MNIEEWVIELEEAYQSIGTSLLDDRKQVLLTELSASSSEAQKQVVAEAIDVMTRYFFRKVVAGRTFGPPSRIKERFGDSVEENYGLSTGPFIDMARAYWTYKTEVGDLFPKHHSLALSQALREVEMNIGSVFFPTPGPMSIPVEKRVETQRQILDELAPDIDIERFLSESPILRAEAGRRGCFGLLLFSFLTGILLALRYFT